MRFSPAAHYYLCTSNTPCFRGQTCFAQTVCQPLPATTEEFSGWLRRVFRRCEWVAPIGFTQNPMEKQPFETQIAAVRPKNPKRRDILHSGLFHLRKKVPWWIHGSSRVYSRLSKLKCWWERLLTCFSPSDLKLSCSRLEVKKTNISSILNLRVPSNGPGEI